MGSCPDTDIDRKIVQNLEINYITKIKLPKASLAKRLENFSNLIDCVRTDPDLKRFKGLADSVRFPENHSSTLFKSFHAG